ncbi:unnamed protein product [Linum trigynum]|uniref:Uncharacterized protein n=1 Tax=Linum trigynum TaxID=586398 RepID=A0AAV2D2I6_9ROSI
MLAKVKSEGNLEAAAAAGGRGEGTAIGGQKSISRRIPEEVAVDEKKPSTSKPGIVIAEDPDGVLVDVVTFAAISAAPAPPPPNKADLDATEHSSSFADSLSDTDKCFFGNSEGEVESEFSGDGDIASPFDAFSSLFYSRKKKVSNHWRKFIRPLMWRCKWAELKIKEIESQHMKYSGELAAYEQRKQSGVYQSIPEGFCAKSLPFLNACYRRKSKKRRKRKRVEDSMDILSSSSFLPDHPFFSYFESKRATADGASVVDEFDPIAFTDAPRTDAKDQLVDTSIELPFAFGDSDAYLEIILLKIESVHSHVHKLKDQLDSVITNNAAKFSSWDNLCLLAPCGDEGQSSSAPSPVLSVGGFDGETMSPCGDRYTEGNQPGYDMSELVLPGSAVSSFGEAVHVPDVIESTVGMLADAEVTFHEPQIEHPCENVLENVLIKNEAADNTDAFMGTTTMTTTNCKLKEEEEHHHHRSEAIEKGHKPTAVEEEEITNGRQVLITTSKTEELATGGESSSVATLKSCLALEVQIPTNKRKRGERKAGPGTGGWNKKSSGDDDAPPN